MRRWLTVTVVVATVPLHNAFSVSPIPTASTSTCTTTVTTTRTGSFVLWKRPKRQRTEFVEIDNDNNNNNNNIPERLELHVDAKRPVLGHVVPYEHKQRQKTLRAKGGSSSPKLRAQGQARFRESYNNPSNLRILGGTARGRKLVSPDVYLRPMMGKVREAVFSSLQSFGVYDQTQHTTTTTGTKHTTSMSTSTSTSTVRHLDIFAGSGSVGLESLSRGALHCTFVDLSANCCEAARVNLETIFPGQGDVVQADVYDVLADTTLSSSSSSSSYGTFDVVTLCPPYEEIVYADLLRAVASSPRLHDDTVVVIEYPVELGSLPHVLHGEEGKLIGLRNRKYGRTVIAMYIHNPTGRLESAQSRPEEFIIV